MQQNDVAVLRVLNDPPRNGIGVENTPILRVDRPVDQRHVNALLDGAADKPPGRTEPVIARSEDLLQNGVCPCDLLQTALAVPVQTDMCIGVIPDLVPFVAHALNEIFHAFDLLADEEEGRMGAPLLQTVEQRFGRFGMRTVVKGEGDIARCDGIVRSDSIAAAKRNKCKQRQKQQAQKTPITSRNDHPGAIICAAKRRKNRADLQVCAILSSFRSAYDSSGVIVTRRYRSFLCLLLLPLLALVPLRSGDAVTAYNAVTPRYIALTFDDGPHAETTEALLDGLQERGAHATFFLIGEQIEGMEYLVERMRDEGHQVGNHTDTHVRLDRNSQSGLQEIARADAVLQQVLGPGDYWLRPPWGFVSSTVKQSVDVPLIYWSVDTQDWSVLNADTVARRIIQNAQNGDIVLLHDPYPTSVKAALSAIDALSSQGYQFVTVEELFRVMDVTPEAGHFYLRPDEEVSWQP